MPDAKIELTALERDAVLDLIENAIATMAIVDREDIRWHAALVNARKKVIATVGRLPTTKRQ